MTYHAKPNGHRAARDTPRLFLADDNLGDGLLLEIAFRDAGVAVDITQSCSGGEALARLKAAALIQPFPYHLIVLDLNMPELDGVEVLERLQMVPGFPRRPRVILTSSTDPRDRLRGLRLHPDAFLTKPDDYRGMAGVVAALEPFLYPDAREPEPAGRY